MSIERVIAIEMKIKKGELFLLSCGTYSDYDVKCLCRALVDIDCKNLVSAFRADNPDFKQYDSESKVIHWMINVKKMAEEVQRKELWLGDYGDLNIQVYDNDRNIIFEVDNDNG